MAITVLRVLQVAPLRARASDIGPLQYHLLRKLAKAKGLAKMTLTQAAGKLTMLTCW